MKCVARRACQGRNKDGKIVTYAVGDVVEFDECPPYFEAIEATEGFRIDFATAKEEELLEGEYNLDDLKDYIREKYGKNPANRGKVKTVEMLLDCRYRDTSTMDLNKVL